MKKIFLLAMIFGLTACSAPPEPPTYKYAKRVPINAVKPVPIPSTTVNTGIVPS
jgi:hypothetical protein